MAGYLGTKAVLLSTTAANVVGNATISGDLTVDTDTLYVNSTTNRVGIGTSSPTQVLDITTAGTTRAFIRNTNLTSSGMYIGEDGTGQQILGLGAYPMRFSTNGTERMRIDSSGNVGIGTTANQSASATNEGIWFAPGSNSSFSANTTPLMINRMGTGGNDRANISLLNNGQARADIGTVGASSGMYIAVNGSERMRIDSSGNLLVGTTSVTAPIVNNAGAGVVIRGSNGQIYAGGAATQPLTLNRETSDGEIISLRKDGASVGSIGAFSGDLFIGQGDAALRFNAGGNNATPYNVSTGAASDNFMDMGSASSRFDDIYATNGTIQTSDANEKQDVASLTATEMLVAARISTGFKTFRWIDSVADKGDDARTHTGVIAQDVQAAFVAEGLDAGDYSLFTSATWWETQTDVPAVDAIEAVEGVQAVEAVEYSEAVEATYDAEGIELTPYVPEVQAVEAVIGVEAVEEVEAKEAYTRTDTFDTLAEAPEGATERTRMGIRYPELLAFVGAYNEQRFASIETRLTALEAV